VIEPQRPVHVESAKQIYNQSSVKENIPAGPSKLQKGTDAVGAVKFQEGKTVL
jgi:hypothetical protein